MEKKTEPTRETEYKIMHPDQTNFDLDYGKQELDRIESELKRTIGLMKVNAERDREQIRNIKKTIYSISRMITVMGFCMGAYVIWDLILKLC